MTNGRRSTSQDAQLSRNSTTRRQLIRAGVISGTAGLAGCNILSNSSSSDILSNSSNLGLPQLQRAWFRVDGNGDLRFALGYDEEISKEKKSELDGTGLFHTPATVEVVRPGLQLDWGEPYAATKKEISQSLTERETPSAGKYKDVTDRLAEIVPENVPDSQQVGTLVFSRHIFGRVTDVAQPDKQLSGYRIEIPNIKYSGEMADSVQTKLQFPDGYTYMFPPSLPDSASGSTYRYRFDDDYNFSLRVTETEIERASFTPLDSNGTTVTFPVGMPRAQGSTLLPSLTHRTSRVLSALRASAQRRKFGLAVPIGVITENNTVLDSSTKQLLESRNFGDVEPAEALANTIGSVVPVATSPSGIAIYVLGIGLFALGTALSAGVAGAGAIWIGGEWLISLLGASLTIRSAVESLKNGGVLDAGRAIARKPFVNSILSPESNRPSDPPAFLSVPSLSKAQARWATTALALADEDELPTVVQAYHQLLTSQQEGLSRITNSIRADNRFGKFKLGEDVYERWQSINTYMESQYRTAKTVECAPLESGRSDDRGVIQQERRMLENYRKLATQSRPQPTSTRQQATTRSPGSSKFVVSLDPRATYKRTGPNDDVPAPDPVVLSEHDIRSGDELRLRTIGTYTIGPSGRERCGVIGVFSETTNIRGSNQQDRVPGALDAGEDYTTVDTLANGRPTDIEEDFLVSGDPDNLDNCAHRETTVTVPAGAEYLFLAVEDDRYTDNSGDIRVEIDTV